MLEVERAELWTQLEAAAEVTAHVVEILSPTRRRVGPKLLAETGEALRRAGFPVLVRTPPRPLDPDGSLHAEAEARIAALAPPARRLLVRAQRHALDGRFLGSRVWDPLFDGAHVRSLLGSELIEAEPGDVEPLEGPYRLSPWLPPPPPVGYAFDEAAMERVDDLSEPGASMIDLLHDLASLVAALSHHRPRRTLAGSLDKSTSRKLGQRLGEASMARDGDFEAHARWVRALRVMELLGGVSIDPMTREIGLEPGLEDVLQGSDAEAMDRLVHRLVAPDLQPALPAIRAALAAAGDGAVDSMIFFEELAQQHRDVLHAPWHRDGAEVYPAGGDMTPIPFDDEGFERIETRQIEALLARLDRLGLVVRADGVFAATADGRIWATGEVPQRPPVWVSSDLGLTVPPRSVTPWERYQLEQLARCTRRDVVDTYALDRKGLERWLASHAVEEALELLARRCPGLPSTVAATLTDWARSAERVVLWVGAAAPA